jgi:hypothetical protein
MNEISSIIDNPHKCALVGLTALPGGIDFLSGKKVLP